MSTEGVIGKTQNVGKSTDPSCNKAFLLQRQFQVRAQGETWSHVKQLQTYRKGNISAILTPSSIAQGSNMELWPANPIHTTTLAAALTCVFLYLAIFKGGEMRVAG